MRRLLLCLLLSTSLPCLGVPAHYIVLREGAQGEVTVAFRTRVDLAALPQLERTHLWEGDGSRLERRLSARIVREGKAQYETDVAAARWLRGEFAATGGLPEQATHLPAQEFHYVLRIPADPEGGLLQVGRPSGSTDKGRAADFAHGKVLLQIDLGAPEDTAAQPKADASDVVPIIQNGDPGNRLDLLILAEGYTADQKAKFQADALRVANAFLSISPYSDYRNLVNVSGLFLVSQQAGASKPACAETPTMPVVTVNTALSARFCSSGLRRLVTINTGAALAAAAVAPNWDKAIALVNDEEYGGSGGTVSVATLAPEAAELVQHEFGHSFTNLADEYETPFPGYPGCSDVAGGASPCEANVTNVLGPLKWTGWVTAGTAIPTTSSLSDQRAAGAWAGARYFESGMYRQCFNGIMRSLSSTYFCKVDGEAYVKRLYASGWGAPSGGIRNIEPGSASPSASTVSAAAGAAVALRAKVAGPGTPVSAVWKVDGTTVKSESLAHGATASYDYAAQSGSHTVTLTVTDASSFLLSPNTATQTWQVTGSGTAPAATRLSNIATRGPVFTGDSVMIGGFIIQGTAPKKVLVTARGPSMAAQGVSGTLPDPFLTLYSGATPIASNDDFGSAPNASEIPASMKPGNAKEAAILTTLGPGAYTAIVTGVGGTTGIAIVEAFEVDKPESPLANIATRAPVLTGDHVMIGGFIIQGDGPKTVLVTARGPSLATQGVPGTLADPVLTLYSGQTVVATNDDWGTNTNAAAIQATGQGPSNAKEAALLVTLNPGAYTAIVTGAGGATGIGIVEVFAQ